MNKEQTITKLEEIIYTYENKTESNKLSEFAEGRLSAFRFSLNLIKNINFIHCCETLEQKGSERVVITISTNTDIDAL